MRTKGKVKRKVMCKQGECRWNFTVKTVAALKFVAGMFVPTGGRQTIHLKYCVVCGNKKRVG